MHKDQNEPYSKSEAITSLQKIVMSWINDNPKRTKSSLARESGVSEAAVRRLLNDSTLPNAENISKLLIVVRNAKTTKELVGDKSDELSKLVAFHMPYLAFEEPSETLLYSSFAAKLNSQVKKMLFVKLDALKTLSVAAIEEEFGKNGLNEARTLVSEGVFAFTDGVFALTSGFENTFIADGEASKQIMDIGLRTYFKPESNVNYSLFEAGCISKKGYGLVMDVYENAHKEIRKIVAEHSGEVPLFAAGFMDTMTTEPFFDKGGKDE